MRYAYQLVHCESINYSPHEQFNTEQQFSEKEYHQTHNYIKHFNQLVSRDPKNGSKISVLVLLNSVW